MTEASDVPPMSGNNLPLKELKTESIPKIVDPLKKKRSRLYVFFILLCLFIFLAGIGTGIYFKQINQGPVIPSPSPSPQISQEASPSVLPGTNLKKRIEIFEQELSEVDLKESDLLPLNLDFKLRFDLPQ